MTAVDYRAAITVIDVPSEPDSLPPWPKVVRYPDDDAMVVGTVVPRTGDFVQPIVRRLKALSIDGEHTEWEYRLGEDLQTVEISVRATHET